MDYEYIDKAEVDSRLLTRYEDRLRALESDHVNVTADVELAGSAGNPAQEQRQKQIETEISDLRGKRDKVKQRLGRSSSSS